MHLSLVQRPLDGCVDPLAGIPESTTAQQGQQHNIRAALATVEDAGQQGRLVGRIEDQLCKLLPELLWPPSVGDGKSRTKHLGYPWPWRGRPVCGFNALMHANAKMARQFVDGRVSIEVDPRLAHETEATEKQAEELWAKVNRPNAMIKIPATLEGLPAITATLAKGISVNVTLIFSLERYEQVIDAYIEGIAQADANGHDLKHIGSVASFFVSRVDTAVDKLLEANGSDEAKALEGKAAVANARLAYELFENKFANDPRWAALEAKGAKKQRPLWASTGTKNAAYSDCKYVDELVAPFVVNTMPEKTLNALADHGNGAPSIKGTYEESHAVMDKLAELGINIKDVTDKLEADGVAAFIKSWDTVLADVQAGIDRVNG